MSRDRRNRQLPWWVEGYYGHGGRKGSRKYPNLGRAGELEGDLAIAGEFGNMDQRDLEIQILLDREDIGRIESGWNG